MSLQFVAGRDFLFGFSKRPKNFCSTIEQEELIKDFLEMALKGLDIKKSKKQKFFSYGLISGAFNFIKDEKAKKRFSAIFYSIINSEQLNVFRRISVEISERNIFYVPEFFVDFEKGQSQAREFIENNFKY